MLLVGVALLVPVSDCTLVSVLIPVSDLIPVGMWYLLTPVGVLPTLTIAPRVRRPFNARSTLARDRSVMFWIVVVDGNATLCPLYAWIHRTINTRHSEPEAPLSRETSSEYILPY